MAEDFKNYDPQSIQMIFKGITLQSFADGSMVKPSRKEDSYSMVTGAQGDTVRIRNRNRTGSVAVQLLQSSPTNDLLSAIADQDEQFGTGAGTLMIKDLRGTTLIRATNAWIRKYPDPEFAKTHTNREWIFDCAVIEFTPVGGSVV